MVKSLVVKVNNMQDEMSNGNRDKETLRLKGNARNKKH